MRTCNRCKEKKDFSEFPKEDGGFAAICKECKNIQSKKHYEKTKVERLHQIAEQRKENPEYFNEKSKKSYYKNKDEIVIKRCLDRTENPIKYRNYWLKKYGITSDNYDEMYTKQKGRCAICQTHSSELNKPLCVDHSHSTGKVRALLCTKCNTGIGLFNEDVELLDKVTKYLESYMK